MGALKQKFITAPLAVCKAYLLKIFHLILPRSVLESPYIHQSLQWIDRVFLHLRKSALLEIIAFYSIAMFIDLFFGTGDRYWHVHPHPFWVIILLITLQYGTKEGLLTAISAVLLLLVGNLPEQLISQDMYDYLFEVVYRPILWISCSVVIGEFRMRQIHLKEELEQHFHESQQREHFIADSYTKLKSLKENLETRLASQLRSSITTYQSIKSIETLDPIEVLLGAEEMIVNSLNPEKFSVFSLGDEGFEIVSSHGWTEEDKYERRFFTNSMLYKAIMKQKRVFCAINLDDEQILGEDAILAGPIINAETGEVAGMIKIESMGFADLNLSNVETFRILCEWIGLAYANADMYQKAQKNTAFNEQHQLFSYNYYIKQKEFMANLAEHLDFDLSLIKASIENASSFSSEDQRLLAVNLSNIVTKTLRKIDQAFDYESDSEYVIVLPGTPLEHTQIIINKLQQALKQSRIGVLSTNEEPKYRFVAESIHKKQSVKRLNDA